MLWCTTNQRPFIIKLQRSRCTQGWKFLASKDFRAWSRAQTSFQTCKKVKSRKIDRNLSEYGEQQLLAEREVRLWRHWGMGLKKIERDTYTPMFIAAPFTIPRTWKQPKRLSADKWIRKFRYTYIMEYYSVIKKNVFESVLMRWMKLEPIIQSEAGQKEKHQYSILTHIYGI